MTTPGSHHPLDELRDTAAALLQHRQQQAATDACGLGSCCMSMGSSPPIISITCTKTLVIRHLLQQQRSLVADLCTTHGRQPADSIIVNFLSADSRTGMFRQLPTLFFGRERYSLYEATIITAKKRDVHCTP